MSFYTSHIVTQDVGVVGGAGRWQLQPQEARHGHPPGQCVTGTAWPILPPQCPIATSQIWPPLPSHNTAQVRLHDTPPGVILPGVIFPGVILPGVMLPGVILPGVLPMLWYYIRLLAE